MIAVLHFLKFVPALMLAIVAVIFFIASTGGDNSDARALAGILFFPGLFFAVLALVAGFLAWRL